MTDGEDSMVKSDDARFPSADVVDIEDIDALVSRDISTWSTKR